MAARAVRRGVFILFEGIDRCGKTTQSKRLVEKLNKSGHRTQHMRFPDRTTTIGKMINDYLTNAVDTDDRSIHLLFSANRWEKMREMRELLNSGVNLVVDRYSYSGVAFTASKGFPVEWCFAPEVGMIAPDLVVWLDMPLDDQKSRGGFGEERYEKAEMQAKVQRIFGEFARDDDRWCPVDARGSIDSIHQKISSLALQSIQVCSTKPITLLGPSGSAGGKTGAVDSKKVEDEAKDTATKESSTAVDEK